MNYNNKQIIEALHRQPLSEEEKQSRHILGRLFGPIATCSEATRNGRTYNRDLWEKALNDDVFKEKIKNKSLFLELGHPSNREETDRTKVCACIPEMPKIVNNDLYAYVDILDTDNGRLLKTLCDYGFVPGISSRGSGDVDDNDEVDPDTFFLETWDIVQLPAVKKARLQMAEGLDTNELKLKKALTESINKADAKGKVAMKEALNNLNIDLNEDKKPKTADESEAKACEAEDCSASDKDKSSFIEQLAENLKDDEIDQFLTAAKSLGLKTVGDLDQWAKEHGDLHNQQLLKARQDEAAKKTAAPANETSEPKQLKEAEKEAKKQDEKAPEEVLPAADSEKEDEPAAEEDKAVEEKDEPAAEEDKPIEPQDVPAEEEQDDDNSLVLNDAFITDLKSFVKAFDNEAALTVLPVEIAGTNYIPEMILEKDEDGNLLVSLKFEDLPEKQEDAKDTDKAESAADVPSAKDTGENGAVVECLKNTIRQKANLLKQLNEFKSKNTVGNSEVTKLKEECEKYKFAFRRLSKNAENANKQAKLYRAKIAKLEESLTISKNELDKADMLNSKKLTESLEANKLKIKQLNEQLEQANSNVLTYKNIAKSKANAAMNYKAKCSAILSAYIEKRADRLGVAPAEITRRLSENYTLDDIDTICESLMESTHVSRLPLRIKEVSINSPLTESKINAGDYNDSDGGYAIDDSLLSLAGLK